MLIEERAQYKIDTPMTATDVAKWTKAKQNKWKNNNHTKLRQISSKLKYSFACFGLDLVSEGLNSFLLEKVCASKTAFSVFNPLRTRGEGLLFQPPPAHFGYISGHGSSTIEISLTNNHKFFVC